MNSSHLKLTDASTLHGSTRRKWSKSYPEQRDSVVRLMLNTIRASALMAFFLLPFAVIAQDRAVHKQSEDDLSNLLGETSEPTASSDQKDGQGSPAQLEPHDRDKSEGQSDAPPAPLDGVAAAAPVSVSNGADASDQKASTKRQSGVVEEIIVTANKRAENIQNVPISIQAFSGSQLEATGVRNISDLAMKTPGMSFDTVAGYAVIYIRGIGTDAFVPSNDLSVAPYIDGVYFPASFGLARDLVDVKRVEILKGPQGTLFGRNATGGAINIVTEDPPDSFEIKGRTVFGNFNEIDNKITIGGKILSTLSATGSLIYNMRNDYYKSTVPSQELQGFRDVGFNGKIEWRPSDFVGFTLTGFDIKTEGAGTLAFASIKPSPLGTLLGVHNSPDYKTDDNTYNYGRDINQVVALTVDVHPGPLDVKSITSYQSLTQASNTDFDGSSTNLVAFGSPDPHHPELFSRVFAQELQLLSNDDTAFSQYLKWVAGLYYLRSTVGYDPVDFEVAGLVNGIGGLASGTLPIPINVPIVTTILDQLTSQFGPIVNPLVTAEATVSGLLDTRAYSAYAQGVFTPVEWVDITLGGRVQRERRRVYDATVGVDASIAGKDESFPLLSFAPDELQQTTYSPKLSIDTKPFEDTMLYASFQRAFKSGSFNIINLTEAPSKILPETVTTIEAGIKTELLERSVQLDASIFRNKTKDLQSQFLSLISGGVVQYQNAQLATSEGVDFTAKWVVDRSFHFDGGATYLKSRYNQFDNAQGFDPTTGILSSKNNYSGNKIVRNPPFSATAGFEYLVDTSSGTLTAGSDYYYNSGYFFDAENLLHQSHYYLVNAHLSYTYEPWKTMVSLYGNNLNRAKYYIFELQDDFGVVGRLASPTVYGVRLNWTF